MTPTLYKKPHLFDLNLKRNLFLPWKETNRINNEKVQNAKNMIKIIVLRQVYIAKHIFLKYI